MPLRAAHPADFSAITQVWEDAVHATHPFLTGAHRQTLRHRIPIDWLPALDLRVVTAEDGQILGFSGVAGEKLEMLFVAPAAHRQGIGKALLGHAVAHQHVRLVDVNEQNPQAIGFYQRMGFTTIGRSEVDGMGWPYPLVHMRLADASHGTAASPLAESRPSGKSGGERGNPAVPSSPHPQSAEKEQRVRSRLRTASLAAPLALALWLGHAAPAQAEAFPRFNEVHTAHLSSDTWLLDRHSQRIQRVRTDFSARRGDWVALADVSPALLHAILLTEDKRFYEHSGVDWSAVSSAAWSNLWNERTRGASTITMQLAGLLNEELRARPGGRSWGQKWRQLWSARELEQHWSKAEVLEAYLNLVPFRGELIGIDAMARSLFGKAAHGLDLREAAIAAALLRAPNAPIERVAERACLILQQADSPWGEDCRALSLYTSAALRHRHYAAVDGAAPHFARHLLTQRTASNHAASTAPPTTIASTLDLGLQQHAAHTLRQHLAALQGQNVQDGAVLVLDNASGAVLAWVGSSGAALSQAAEVDAVLAPRQPGSTLKPFLYAQAIAERRLTAASLLDDSPARIPTEYGIYAPENYDEGYQGWVSMRQALGSSLNIPAVRALRMVSPEAFSQQLRALGFHLPEPSGFYGYSLALGGVDVSLLQLTNAYRTLANGGSATPVQLQSAAAEATSAIQVVDAAASFIVTDILADRHARMLTFGTDSALATRFWSAVKTGTSKDMRDNWAIGYTAHHTIGVWVGNADGSPMQEVSGVSGAAPVWASVAAYAHRLRPSHAPAPPDGLLRMAVRYAPPPGHSALATGGLVETARQEWFLPGTEQPLFALAGSAATPEPPAHAHGSSTSTAAPRILQPTDGTIVALDPDIPPANQMLRVAGSAAQAVWTVNGQAVTGLANPRQWYWAPTPGRHLLELRSADGTVVQDSIRIEVRGASLDAVGLQEQQRRASASGQPRGG